MNEPKIVNKPWGREVWLELNDRYCYKRIEMKAGHRSSLQHHERKLETNYIESGEVELRLQDEHGEMQVHQLKAGEHFTVLPPRVHRVVALTDIVLMEVSTPEVDDVHRLEDDTGRGDGRIQSEHDNEG
ncbi:MAG: cupin [Candidatus Zambryskibacteria bacterium]|nr:cupin [Candidatus Zambryskibacteria bacterium]